MSYRCLICEGKGYNVEIVKTTIDGKPLLKESKPCSFCDKDLIIISSITAEDDLLFLDKKLMH